MYVCMYVYNFISCPRVRELRFLLLQWNSGGGKIGNTPCYMYVCTCMYTYMYVYANDMTPALTFCYAMKGKLENAPN